MAEGQRVAAHVNPDASGGTDPDKTVEITDFLATGDSSKLTVSDAVVVTGYVHENDVTVNRLGDPDDDGTYEINVGIESRSGAGERADVTHIVTDQAALEVVNDAGSAQNVTLYGIQVDASKVFVEQNDGVANGNEVARTTGARGQEETIYELAMSTDANLARRHDPDDNGTFEVDANVDSFTGSQVIRDQLISMRDGKVDYSGAARSNPAMETALINDSGGTGDYMILGSIGVSV